MIRYVAALGCLLLAPHTAEASYETPREYCERDPGGETIANGGKMTLNQCIEANKKTPRADLSNINKGDELVMLYGRYAASSKECSSRNAYTVKLGYKRFEFDEGEMKCNYNKIISHGNESYTLKDMVCKAEGENIKQTVTLTKIDFEHPLTVMFSDGVPVKYEYCGSWTITSRK